MTALWQVSVRADPEREESIAAGLEQQLRMPPAVYRDADTGVLIISVYPEKIDAPPARLRRLLSESLGVPPGAITVGLLPKQDWATPWKKHFQPIQIGGRLLIKPSWSRARAKPGQRVVVLDPGLSFGTGQHATTEFCLRQLTRARQPDVAQSFLDIGTGSGILAIAAAKLGYSPVTAFDFDPEATRIAQGNARKNRIDDRLVIQRADLTKMAAGKKGRYDVICANLTYDLLASQAGKLARWLAPGGKLIVAGILDEQFEIVTESFHNFGLTLSVSKLKNKWRSGQFAS